MMIYVLGLDLGLANCGWAVASLHSKFIIPQEMGLITTKKSTKKQNVMASDDNFRRAKEVSSELEEIVAKYNPGLICVEAQSFPRSASSAAKTAMVWGSLATLVNQSGKPCVHVRPVDIKEAACGKAKASKKEVQEGLDIMFEGKLEACFTTPVAPSNREHSYDALGAIVAAKETEPMIMLRNMTSILRSSDERDK